MDAQPFEQAGAEVGEGTGTSIARAGTGDGDEAGGVDIVGVRVGTTVGCAGPSSSGGMKRKPATTRAAVIAWWQAGAAARSTPVPSACP